MRVRCMSFILASLAALACVDARAGVPVHTGFPLPSQLILSPLKSAGTDEISLWAAGTGAVDVRGIAQIGASAVKSRITGRTKIVLTEYAGVWIDDGYAFEAISDCSVHSRIPSVLVRETYRRRYGTWEYIGSTVIKHSWIRIDLEWKGIGTWVPSYVAAAGVGYIPWVEVGVSFSRPATVTGSVWFGASGVRASLSRGPGLMEFWR